LANTVVSGTAAGGAVTVEATCDQRVKRVHIGRDAVDPDDVETLEDLVTVAVNDALGKASETSQKRMASVTGGMKLPGMM
jgi:DNA-binding YbaB/EbfC family protein